MPYTNVLPIAYEIDTFSLVEKDVFGDFETYRGNTDDGKDVSKRCEIMCNAIDIAAHKASEHPGGTSSDTLKVFMAPEFYFRGKEGAYPIEAIAEIMPTLREHTKASKFADWLFVFGTALGRLEDENGKFEIINMAMVQKGGVAEADGSNERIIYKEYISAIDFSGPKYGKHGEWKDPDNRTVDIAGGKHKIKPVEGSHDPVKPDQASNALGIEYSAAGMQGTLEGRCVFVQDDVCVALEVCRDHLLGRLKLSPPKPGDYVPQVHLVTSAGASLEDSNVAGRVGAVAFNVDGHSRSELKTKTGANQCSAKIDGDPEYPISLKGASWWTVTHNKYFGEHGRVRFYPSQTLPDPVQAT